MRALTTILFATTTLLSGVAATATAAGTGLPALTATHEQMVKVEDTYALSDGRRARVFTMDGTLYIELGHNRQELELVGTDLWTTRDRSLSVQFKPGRSGNEIAIDYRGGQDTAPIRLAARERHGRGAID